MDLNLLEELLHEIENNSNRETVDTKDELMLEAEKLYTYYALKICMDKLTNTDPKDSKEGIQRTRAYMEKIQKLDF